LASAYKPAIVSPIFVVFYLLPGRCESSVLPFVELTLCAHPSDDGHLSVVFYLLIGRCNPLFVVIIIQLELIFPSFWIFAPSQQLYPQRVLVHSPFAGNVCGFPF
jgi:hypothetical protein